MAYGKRLTLQAWKMTFSIVLFVFILACTCIYIVTIQSIRINLGKFQKNISKQYLQVTTLVTRSYTYQTKFVNKNKPTTAALVVEEDSHPKEAIGIGLAITSGYYNSHQHNHGGPVSQWPIFLELMPSFCKTLSSQFLYHFYLAYDNDDLFFKQNKSLLTLRTQFNITVSRYCQGSFPTLFLVKCNHTKKPVWAQNDAMMAAYRDNMTYLYRVNDDTIFETKNWTEKLIFQLQRFNPPNIGVVGPFYREGNTGILTYEFVHRTHIDILGFYYPPSTYVNWYADDWMTAIYTPGRAKKVVGVHIKHTLSRGTRYAVHVPKKTAMENAIQYAKKNISEYIKSKQNSWNYRKETTSNGEEP